MRQRVCIAVVRCEKPARRPQEASRDRDLLDIYLGEVHALVGDNAAGKSTLIKTLAGAVRPDAGTISFDGREVVIESPRHAKALGIETVYQDLALADNLDVPANVFLGREMTRYGWLLDNRSMEDRARALLARLKINIPNVRQKVRAMSGGQRQSIAIARSVCFNARVVILDEPTAALGVQETGKVYALIREMREQGCGVLLISHNLNHVFENSDRINLRIGVNLQDSQCQSHRVSGLLEP